MFHNAKLPSSAETLRKMLELQFSKIQNVDGGSNSARTQGDMSHLTLIIRVMHIIFSIHLLLNM